MDQIKLVKENVNGILPNITLLSMILMSLSKNKTIIKSPDTFKEEYDYIIVGGGSAGSVVASRLSEMPCVTVLLLEAGGEPPVITEVPALTAALILPGSPIDWQYKTTPQEYSAFANEENRVVWHAGKALGGTSVINAMLYIRGNKQNYNDWAAEGATGWSYDEVFPYFLKLEDNQNIDELDPGYHKKGGPLTEEKPAYAAEIKQPLLNALTKMGYPVVDVNGKRQIGVFDFQGTTRNHKRCSAAKAYLDDIRDRPNLDILTYSYAKKILIDKKPNGKSRAYGIEFDRLNMSHTVLARKDVIICSGTIRTPQILMLSGIGPKEHLEKFNIDVVSDLPVGKNLHDHCYASLEYNVNKSITPISDKLLNPKNVLDYINNKKGPYTSPYQISLLAFLDGLNTTSTSRDFPRQELYFTEYLDVKTALDLLDRTEEALAGRPRLTSPVYHCDSSLLQPRSRGEITLNSVDPYAMPNINPNYYKDERDLRDVVEGMKICHSVAQHPEMREIDPQLRTDMYPKCEKFHKKETMEEYFYCIAKQYVLTFWHYAGTARMGSRNDSTSVVDSELRVIGIEGLRAVSGAVFPKVTSGNMNVPVIMVAEKASDIIKKEISCTKTHVNQKCRRRNNG